MTLSALGIFSAAGAGGGVALSDYELIETYILGSSQSAVTFSGLGAYASVYKHLQIRSVERQSNSVVESRGVLSINGSAGSRSHYLIGTGSSVLSADEGAGSMPFYSPGANDVANNFAGRVTDILDPFSTTKNKTVRNTCGFTSSSFNRIFLQSGLWASTASVTSITFTSAANYVAGSRFSLYGIKG
jgi:hypothetical protein